MKTLNQFDNMIWTWSEHDGDKVWTRFWSIDSHLIPMLFQVPLAHSRSRCAWSESSRRHCWFYFASEEWRPASCLPRAHEQGTFLQCVSWAWPPQPHLELAFGGHQPFGLCGHCHPMRLLFDYFWFFDLPLFSVALDIGGAAFDTVVLWCDSFSPSCDLNYVGTPYITRHWLCIGQLIDCFAVAWLSPLLMCRQVTSPGTSPLSRLWWVGPMLWCRMAYMCLAHGVQTRDCLLSQCCTFMFSSSLIICFHFRLFDRIWTGSDMSGKSAGHTACILRT